MANAALVAFYLQRVQEGKQDINTVPEPIRSAVLQVMQAVDTPTDENETSQPAEVNDSVSQATGNVLF